MTFVTAIFAVLRIPQRTLDIARHHSRKSRQKNVRGLEVSLHYSMTSFNLPLGQARRTGGRKYASDHAGRGSRFRRAVGLDDVRNGFGRDSCAPDLTEPVYAPKDPACGDSGRLSPSSTARFAHARTGTVRMRLPLPIRSARTHCCSRVWRSSVLRPTSSARLSPHPISNTRMARSRLPRAVSKDDVCSSVLD